MATRTNMFEVESNFDDLNLHSQVDHSFQDSNIRTSYFMENEYVPQITEDSHFQSQIEQEGPLQPLVDKWGDFEDDEAYWSDDEEDEDGPCRNDDGVNVRNNGGGEEGDNKCGEEGDEILSNYESEDKEHPLLSESEDEQNPINMLNETLLGLVEWIDWLLDKSLTTSNIFEGYFRTTLLRMGLILTGSRMRAIDSEQNVPMRVVLGSFMQHW